MEFICNGESVSISDDEMYEIDRKLEDIIFSNSIWKTIDPYGDKYLSGDELSAFVYECKTYELHLKDDYLITMNQIRSIAEKAYKSKEQLYICGD